MPSKTTDRASRRRPRGGRGKAKSKKGVTPAALARLALTLPGAEEGTSYGTPAWKVGGKLFARLLPDASEVVVKVAFDDRDFLMRANPRAFHITDHYTNYEMMLVRLSEVDADELRVLLEASWLRSAPKRLLPAPGRED
jgi:hypothetical protein